jgi:hypothetical protein
MISSACCLTPEHRTVALRDAAVQRNAVAEDYLGELNTRRGLWVLEGDMVCADVGLAAFHCNFNCYKLVYLSCVRGGGGWLLHDEDTWAYNWGAPSQGEGGRIEREMKQFIDPKTNERLLFDNLALSYDMGLNPSTQR